MLTTGFRDMCSELGIFPGASSKSANDVDRIFIAVNSNSGGVKHSTVGSGANSTEAITRWEMVEVRRSLPSSRPLGRSGMWSLGMLGFQNARFKPSPRSALGPHTFGF